MNLGEDVVFEILLRLPVRSLLRFRSVCKEWCTLIKSCVFTDSYLDLRRAMAVDDQLVGLKRTLVRGKDIPYEDDMELVSSLKRTFLDYIKRGMYMISLTCWSANLAPSSSCNDFVISGKSSIINSVDSVYCFLRGDNYFDTVRIINHVDGIVCFINGDNWFDITLVNPALREIRKLPIPCSDIGGFKRDPAPGREIDKRDDVIGFGYDDVSDEYKVVAIVTVYDEDGYGYRYDEYGYECRYRHGLVYYLSTNSWKILGDLSALVSSSPCFELFPSYESVFSHGSIHWCVGSLDIDDDVPCYWILAFDVTNELFREIQFPHGWRYMNAMSPHLFTIDKSTIALVNSTNEFCEVMPPEIQVWVMKEYGDSDSWIKLYSITSPPGFSKVLSFWKKDKLLLQSQDGKLICYDLIRGELDEPEDHCYPIYIYKMLELQLVTGHESFVSVKLV